MGAFRLREFFIPRIAANGTTIMIPVPDGFKAGFGRALNKSLLLNPATEVTSPTVPITTNPANPNYYLEDFQQGELVFVLRMGPSVTSTFKSYLPVRYITRVHMDESSSAALPADGEVYDNIGTNVEAGQIVAFVDIPFGVSPAGTYYIFMERWKRGTGPAATYFVKEPPTKVDTAQVDWLAWGGFAGLPQAPSPTVGMQIRIVASSELGSLFGDTNYGFDKFGPNYASRSFTADLDRFSPRAKLRIFIDNPYPQGGEPAIPAAWEWTIQYPAGKIEITGAELGSRHRSGGFAALSPPTTSGSGCSEVGTTKISVIDPDQTTLWVNVAYRLRAFPACGGRAVPSDFTAAQGAAPKAYDVNGNAITPYAFLDPEYSF